MESKITDVGEYLKERLDRYVEIYVTENLDEEDFIYVRACICELIEILIDLKMLKGGETRVIEIRKNKFLS